MVPNISPGDIFVEWAGQRRKHLSVQLKGDMTFASLRENPGIWGAVAGVAGVALRKSDTLDILAADGLAVCYGVVVSKAQGSECWLDFAPSKIVQMEQSVLFTDGHSEVRAQGNQYVIHHGGADEALTFATAEAAKAEILRRYPQKVVA